ncbi:MAG TPA: Fic family protein [Kofleriaceae bacterium]|jgi:Fic family protein
MTIQPPPPIDYAGIGKTFAAHAELRSVEQDGRYLHWDELRHRDVPTGLTHESWWSLVKLTRGSLEQQVPIRTGPELWFVMTNTVQRLVHEIDRDASGRIEVPEPVANEETRDRYVMSSLIEEAFRSSQLEGASTTRYVAAEMIRTRRAPRTNSERMILNNFRAMEWARENKNRPLDIGMLRELHAIVTADTLDVPDGAGRFRRSDEIVQVMDETRGEVVHTPPGAELIPPPMADLCSFANETTSDEPFIHPVVRAILLHFWLAFDHPFVDGNGRTARALFYWSMLRQGYWLTELISISSVIKKARAKYERAFVYTETDGNDTTYFLLHQLGVLREAIGELFAHLKRKAAETRSLEARYQGTTALNTRQLAALGYISKHPDAVLTIEGHQHSHGVVYQTARTDLLGMVKTGYLRQTKSGKKLVFTAATKPKHSKKR